MKEDNLFTCALTKHQAKLKTSGYGKLTSGCLVQFEIGFSPTEAELFTVDTCFEIC